MKPIMLSISLEVGGGGGAAIVASPPAAPSPNLPSAVKVEPRGSSPCVSSDESEGYSSPCKRLRTSDDEQWISSPSQASEPSSPSPTTHLNGRQRNGSVSSYEAYSPRGKEDLSPLNGCYSADSFEDAKKKRAPVSRQQEELCLVCGDRASGYHYNALTCEGCKGFFRRSVTKNAVYLCKYGNKCEIDMYMRRKCQECRFKKCLTVGMRPECVVPEYQCAIKRECKKTQKVKERPNSTTKDLNSFDKEDVAVASPPSLNGSRCSVSVGEGIPAGKRTVSDNGIKPLLSVQEDLINNLVYYQEQFESPSEDDWKTITDFPLGTSEEENIKRFQHITEITILTVQLIVEFSKRVPGFDTLLREDQITLLKACSSEVMMLRTARKYDIKTDSIVFANNQPYTRENYHSASMGESAEALFPFCRNLCLLKVDNAEYALLTAIVIFSERPALVEPKKVEKIQEYYIDTLKAYVDNQRPPGKSYFAHLLAILTELRTLGNINSDQCFSLKVNKNRQLPPFLEEIWDIQI